MTDAEHAGPLAPSLTPPPVSCKWYHTSSSVTPNSMKLGHIIRVSGVTGWKLRGSQRQNSIKGDVKE